ncbi:CoA pyrophosphatase [Flocculibacter collagenilyticus]|uniref:CoA pyrophosphatase n=1 Tax=Flocculibacter collagenilyticus TaxID=2744479 RepID=UPI0018F48518|nr:CoA pyrophosphatase [Flocculibacter collagenilyticus]
MTLEEFITRFNLFQPEGIVTPFHKQPKLRQASVLIPLIDHGTSLSILLTKRAAHLKHHPGQISFPGGRAEPYDNSVVDTALRETEEEIQISREHVNVIGVLPQYATISGYMITPVIGVIESGYESVNDENEVVDAFEVPFEFFLYRQNQHQLMVHRLGQQYPIHFMPYNDKFIWGATAAMLNQLIHQIEYQ